MNTQSNKWTAIDANAFLHCRSLLQVGLETVLGTTSSVLNELKDQKAKDLINSLPFELKVELPSQKAMKAVREFAAKTGDIVSLSDTDLEVIAIAYDECEKRGLLEKLNREPKKLSEPVRGEEDDDANEYYSRSEQNESNDSQQDQQVEQESPKQESLGLVAEETALVGTKPEAEPESGKQEEEKPSAEDEGWIVVTDKKQKPKKYCSDDDDEWITPENYAQKKMTRNLNKPLEEQPSEPSLPVFIMTSDFSMQNVILQMGIGLRSVEGVQITSVKRFILECYACWAQYPEVKSNKIAVCNKCGYNTLSKVAYSIDSLGNRVLHRRRNWRPNEKVREWKERKMAEQVRYRKNQRQRRSKTSIFA